MPVDPGSFRAALAQWPTGVTVVTTLVDGQRAGMTASSFSSVSLDPPLVSVCLAKSVHTHGLLARTGVFAVNILGKDQAELGKRFARFDPEAPDRFAGSDWETAKTGAPVLPDSLAWLDCSVVHSYDGGDHTIFVGEVLAAETPRLTSPLLYHSRTWGQLADQLPDDVRVTDLSQRGTVADVVAVVGDAHQIANAARDLAACSDVHARPRLVLDDAFADPAATAEAAGELVAAAPCEVVLAGRGLPLQVRDACREVVVRVRPTPVAVRLVPDGGLEVASLLTALKSGATGVDADPAGERAVTPALALRLAQALELSTTLTTELT